MTELLDQTTLEESIRGIEQHFVWQREHLCSALQDRINRKDHLIRGDRYQRYFLVMVTDELFLDRESVARFLVGATFHSRFVTDAYFGLSYHPEPIGMGFCPVFKLTLLQGNAQFIERNESLVK